MVLAIIIFFLFGIAAAIVAHNKGRSAFGGFLLGFFLGPIGLILTFVISSNERIIQSRLIERGELKKCPSCAELIKPEAIKCRYCGSDVEPIYSNYKSPKTSSWKLFPDETSPKTILKYWLIIFLLIIGFYILSVLSA